MREELIPYVEPWPKRNHADRAPMRRNITSEEVAKTALFLCSDMSSGITGETIHVDTGYHIMGI